MQLFLESTGVTENVHWVKAVDGNFLLRHCAGRARHMRSGVVRLSWVCPVAEERVCRTFRMGKSFLAGRTSVWGMAGCTMSQKDCSWLKHKVLLFFCIMEDDCRSNCPSLVWRLVRESLAAVPSLSLLQLGSLTVGTAPMSKRRCVKRLPEGRKLCVAERQALAHCYLCCTDTVPETGQHRTSALCCFCCRTSWMLLLSLLP